MASADTRDETSGRQTNEVAKLIQGLAVVWSADPTRIGEVLLLDETPRVFGRGGPEGSDGRARAALLRQRPSDNQPRQEIELPSMSRAQLELRVERGAVRVENLGKRALLDAEGRPAPSLLLTRVGESFEVKGQFVFVRVDREPELAPLRSLEQPKFPFGESDSHGFVGESPLAWSMRDQCAFVAARAAHVLVLGESGSGKELVAQSIHAASKRGRRAMVARSAATIPAGLADAELFGNLANYPNPGMPERRGLVGEADGTTLFLDEIGELPEELQARLLRVLDERGEYHRLGESRGRTANLRLIGATNRAISTLKHDVAARFRLRLTVPGLNERREDIVLIARHLLRRIATEDAEIASRFLDRSGATVEPRISSTLARALTRHTYRAHCRELEALLWRSIATSQGDELELTAEVLGDLAGEATSVPSSRRATQELSIEEVRAALERANGVQERAWRELGLANRYVLKRLIAKMGLSSADRGDDEP